MREWIYGLGVGMPNILRSPRIGATAQLSPCVSGFIFGPGRDSLLFVRRTDNGLWCLPSGRMEPGESVSQAVIRETLEETGLQTQVVGLVGVYSDPDMVLEYLDGNRWQCLEIDVELRIVGGKLKTEGETDQARYMTFQEIKLGRFIMDTDQERCVHAFGFGLSFRKPYIK